MFRPITPQTLPAYTPPALQPLPTPNLYPLSSVPLVPISQLNPRSGPFPPSQATVTPSQYYQYWPYTPGAPTGPLFTPNPLNSMLEWWRLKGQLPRNYNTGVGRLYP